MLKILIKLQMLVLAITSPLMKDQSSGRQDDSNNLWHLAEDVVANYANMTQKNMELAQILSSRSQGSFQILKLEMRQTGQEGFQNEICRFVMHGKEQVSSFCGIPGGFKPVPSDDSNVQIAAHYAVDDLNRRSNCIYQYKLVSVDHAMLKVVSGIDYLMNITTCMYRPQDTGDCQKISPEIIQHCNVAVLVHSWEKQPKIMTDFKCTGCA